MPPTAPDPTGSGQSCLHAEAAAPGPPLPLLLVAAVAMVDVDGRVLLAQRPQGKHLGGLWEFPGGKVSPGESWEQALVRELVEEVGLRVVPLHLYEEVVHAYPGKTVRLRFFVCSAAEDGEARPIECDAVEWVGREELCRHDFPPADERLLQRLMADNALWGATSS